MRSTLLVIAILVGACTFDGDQQQGDDTPPPAGRYASCLAALDAGVTESGVLTIDPGDNGAPFPAYCDMTTEGGGWTLALKADGAFQTFAFDSPLWTSETPYNPDYPAHDATEAKLPSFYRLGASELLLESGGAAVRTSLIGGATLRDRFAEPLPELLLLDAPHWLELVPLSVFGDCVQVAAINGGDSTYRVRLGMLSQDWDEDTCDGDYVGAVGVGIENNDTCDGGPDSDLTVGSIYDGCDPIAAFVYVSIR